MKTFLRKAKHRRGVVNCWGVALLAALLSGCTSYAKTNDHPWKRVSFEINGSFMVSMELPGANMKNISEEVSFVAVDKKEPQQLFTAKYDPGHGKQRDILLTTIWATVKQTSESSRQNSQIDFDEIRTSIFETDTYWQRDYSYEEFEEISNIKWLVVKLKTQSEGIAFASEIFPGFALIVGVRVFGDEESVADLREYRIITLRKIVKSIRVEPI